MAAGGKGPKKRRAPEVPYAGERSRVRVWLDGEARVVPAWVVSSWEGRGALEVPAGRCVARELGKSGKPRRGIAGRCEMGGGWRFQDGERYVTLSRGEAEAAGIVGPRRALEAAGAIESEEERPPWEADSDELEAWRGDVHRDPETDGDEDFWGGDPMWP